MDVPTHRNLKKTARRRAKCGTLVNDILDPNLRAQNDHLGRFLRGRSNVINSKVSAHFGLVVAPPNVVGGTETILYVTFRENLEISYFH